MKKRLLPFTAALIVMTLGTAQALVLESGSPEQKFRKDVGKQLSKYTLCLIKQLRLCENTGATTAAECLLSPVQATPPADAKGKFVAGVALCESKVDLSKKSPSGDPVADYESIGCPGDSDSGTSGDQRYTDLNAYQAGTIATLKTTLQANAALIDILGCADGSNHTDEADLDCVAAEAQKVAALVKGIFKCGAKCENDYKNLFGNGGGTDAANCADGGDANFQICLNAAIAKATKKGPFDPGVQTFVDNTLAPALTDAGDDIYNQNDCAP
jgi:hypothetical protein